MAGVELATERLILRPPVADDFDAFYALTESPEMRRFLSADPPSREESFNRLLRNAGCWMLYGYGMFSLFEREGGRYVGNCGLFRAWRGLGDDFDPYPEAGWVIGEAQWGQGYATEAMTAILGGFDQRQAGRSVCMIAPGNAGSERIAARLGYEPTGSAHYKNEEVNLYARDSA